MVLGPWHGGSPKRVLHNTSVIKPGPWDADQPPPLDARRLETPTKHLTFQYHQQAAAYDERSARIYSTLLPHAPTSNAAKMAAVRVLAANAQMLADVPPSRPAKDATVVFRQAREPTPRKRPVSAPAPHTPKTPKTPRPPPPSPEIVAVTSISSRHSRAAPSLGSALPPAVPPLPPPVLAPPHVLAPPEQSTPQPSHTHSMASGGRSVSPPPPVSPPRSPLLSTTPTHMASPPPPQLMRPSSAAFQEEVDLAVRRLKSAAQASSSNSRHHHHHHHHHHHRQTGTQSSYSNDASAASPRRRRLSIIATALAAGEEGGVGKAALGRPLGVSEEELRAYREDSERRTREALKFIGAQHEKYDDKQADSADRLSPTPAAMADGRGAEAEGTQGRQSRDNSRAGVQSTGGGSQSLRARSSRLSREVPDEPLQLGRVLPSPAAAPPSTPAETAARKVHRAAAAAAAAMHLNGRRDGYSPTSRDETSQRSLGSPRFSISSAPLTDAAPTSVATAAMDPAVRRPATARPSSATIASAPAARGAITTGHGSEVRPASARPASASPRLTAVPAAATNADHHADSRVHHHHQQPRFHAPAAADESDAVAGEMPIGAPSARRGAVSFGRTVSVRGSCAVWSGATRPVVPPRAPGMRRPSVYNGPSIFRVQRSWRREAPEPVSPHETDTSAAGGVVGAPYDTGGGSGGPYDGVPAWDANGLPVACAPSVHEAHEPNFVPEEPPTFMTSEATPQLRIDRRTWEEWEADEAAAEAETARAFESQRERDAHVLQRRLEHEQAIATLSHEPAFADLSFLELRAILKCATRRSLPRYATAYREGASAAHFFIVLAGMTSRDM